MVFSEDFREQCAASWALAWLGACQVWTPPAEPDLLGRLATLWRGSPEAEIRRLAGWALTSQRFAPRDEARRCASIPRAEFERLLQGYDKLGDDGKAAALVVAWYLRGLDDLELAQRARAVLKTDTNAIGKLTLKELLEHLGAEP